MDEAEELRRETRSSIEIDCNARGEYSLKAKIYWDDADDENIQRLWAEERLEAIDAWFQRRFRGKAD